jgi:polyisoprenoid-binding protein YceI
MSAVDATTNAPTLAGSWRTDPVHSSLDFSVKHMIVSSFRGAVPAFEATVEIADGTLEASGVAQVASIKTQDANLDGHLQSPDFFDAEKSPELRFEAAALTIEGETVRGNGELTVRGITRPVEIVGELSGPASDPWGNERAGLELTTTIDRREFGIEWNAPLPTGGVVLGYAVRIDARLELIRG